MDAVKALVDAMMGDLLDGGGMILYQRPIGGSIDEQLGGAFQWDKGLVLVGGFVQDLVSESMGGGSSGIEVHTMDLYLLARDPDRDDATRRALNDAGDRLKWEVFFNHSDARVVSFHQTVSAMQYVSRNRVTDSADITGHRFRFNMRPRRVFS